MTDNSPSTSLAVPSSCRTSSACRCSSSSPDSSRGMLLRARWRARVLGESCEANPGAARRRLGRRVSADRRGVDLGSHHYVRRRDSRAAGEPARPAARRLPADAPVVPLLSARPLRSRARRPRRRRLPRSPRVDPQRRRPRGAMAGRHRRRRHRPLPARHVRALLSRELDRVVRRADAGSVPDSPGDVVRRVRYRADVRLVRSPAARSAHGLGTAVARSPCGRAHRHRRCACGFSARPRC